MSIHELDIYIPICSLKIVTTIFIIIFHYKINRDMVRK